MLQKIKLLALVFVVMASFFSFGRASAVTCDGKVDTKTQTCMPVEAGQCASGIVNPKDNTKCEPIGSCSGEQNCIADNPIYKDLNLVINFLAGLVAIIVIGNIIVGGIQYTMAGGSADKTASARKRVMNALIAFMIFIFTYGFLQWLIPGGVFG